MAAFTTLYFPYLKQILRRKRITLAEKKTRLKEIQIYLNTFAMFKNFKSIP